MRLRPVLLTLGCSLVSLACSDDSGKPEPTPAPSPTPPAVCEAGPGYREDVSPQRVDSLSAELVDRDGEPVANELVQVCGLDLCTNGGSDTQGRVSITPAQEFREPAFKFGEGRESARFAWLLPDEPELELGVVRTVRLPPLATAVALTPGETITYEELVLTLAPGTKIQIDGLSFRTPEERGLRAVRVPLDRAPEVVQSGPGLELVYATTPVETRFCPPATLAIPNDEGWDAGTEVELWLHGVDITEEFAPYGGWAKVSEAVVSADGERIETTEPGLRVLGVLGFRRRAG